MDAKKTKKTKKTQPKLEITFFATSVEYGE